VLLTRRAGQSIVFCGPMSESAIVWVRNFMFWSAGCFLSRCEGFSCSLNVLYGALGMSNSNFWSKNIKFCLSFEFFFIFGHQNRGSGSVSAFSPKCWIRIRTQWIRIRNAAPMSWQKLTCRKKRRVSLLRMVSGLRQVWQVTYSLIYLNTRYFRPVPYPLPESKGDRMRFTWTYA